MKGLAFLAVRILSIYLFILGLNHLIDFLDYAFPIYLQVIEMKADYTKVLAIVGTPSLVLVICGIVLWFLADKVAQFLIAKHSADTELTLPLKELEGFVLSVIGLVLVIFSLSESAQLMMNLSDLTNQEIGFDIRSYRYAFVEHGIRFLLGLILLFKAEGFAFVLRKIRSSGLE
ncbi:MAG TPA: hypothetical protein VF260_01970 [Bacilli bacterium]